MIKTNYDYESGYHEGSLVEQDALAFLGVFKRIDDVPKRYYLGNFHAEINAEEAWNEFQTSVLKGLSEDQLRYVYGKAWYEWTTYCRSNNVHPALADPQDIDAHLAEQLTSNLQVKSAHDARFRPLFRCYRWMQFHTDYPHRYNPVVMAVLLGGATQAIWETRLKDRETVPKEWSRE